MGFFHDEKDQCYSFDGKLFVKTCFNNVTADSYFLEECRIVFRLSCRFAKKNMQRDIHE